MRKAKTKLIFLAALCSYKASADAYGSCEQMAAANHLAGVAWDSQIAGCLAMWRAIGIAQGEYLCDQSRYEYLCDSITKFAFFRCDRRLHTNYRRPPNCKCRPFDCLLFPQRRRPRVPAQRGRRTEDYRASIRLNGNFASARPSTTGGAPA